MLGWREYQLLGQLRSSGDAQPELSRTEYLRLLSTAKAAGQERTYLMVKVFASIGLALRELPLLTVEAVNQKQVRLSSGGIYQIVCIPAPLREELEEYIQRTGISGGPVFVTKNGKQISRASVTRTIRSLARDARVVPEKCNPRCLRKLYQTTMAEIEASVRLLMEQTYEQLLREEQ